MATESNFYSGVSENISEGGVFVATYQPPPIGTEVDMTIRLPDTDEEFQVVGIVRWCRELGVGEGMPGVGVEWIDLAPDVLRSIQRFIASRSTLLYELGA